MFFGCKVSWLVCKLCCEWLEVCSIDPFTPVSHFTQFRLLDESTSVNLIMGNIRIAVVSEIWRHKNDCTFKGRVIDHSEFFSLA